MKEVLPCLLAGSWWLEGWFSIYTIKSMTIFVKLILKGTEQSKNLNYNFLAPALKKLDATNLTFNFCYAQSR